LANDTELLPCPEVEDDQGVGPGLVGPLFAARRRRIKKEQERIWAEFGQEKFHVIFICNF
jgi:hypothetical protein